MQRLIALEKINSIFSPVSFSMIYGGSMSYGLFYNVRNDEDPSDLDIIIVTEFEKLNSYVNTYLVKNDHLFTDCKRIKNRVNEFVKFQNKAVPMILTHEFILREFSFPISVHFFEMDTLDRMIGNNLYNIAVDRDDFMFTLLDIRDKKMSHKKILLNNFEGKTVSYTGHNLYQETECGFGMNLPGYIIKNKNFYPGIFHNVISPNFTLWNQDTFKVKQLVQGFQVFCLCK